jgi:hypothetical protein
MAKTKKKRKMERKENLKEQNETNREDKHMLHETKESRTNTKKKSIGNHRNKLQVNELEKQLNPFLMSFVAKCR